jgi:Acetyltransferase (GNAT) domain
LSKTEFHEGNLPAGFRLAYPQFLFNTTAHRLTQFSRFWVSFYILRIDRKQALAEVHFCLESRRASSPYRAPFGSFHFADVLEPEELFRFVTWVEEKLKANGAKSIRLKNPPNLYKPKHAAVLEVMLLNLGYKVVQSEISVGLAIDRTLFAKKIHAWERRKLNQSKRADLKVKKLPFRELEIVYRFISECRAERDQGISLSLEALKEVAEATKDHFVLFGVFKGTELAAAAIAINVGQHILYTFYYAHARKFDSLSPVVLLLEGIYQWGRRNKFVFVDLGTSAVNGKPNFPLLNFKLNMGASPGHKLTFEKELR